MNKRLFQHNAEKKIKMTIKNSRPNPVSKMSPMKKLTWPQPKKSMKI